jgi:predicted membrane protein DUF2085
MPLLLRRAFVAASLTWMALLVVAPFLASRPHASALGTALVVAVYGAGSLVCHQLPARSYRLWTAQMPVCARCAGIYVGAAVVPILLSVAQPVRAARAALGRPEGLRDRTPRARQTRNVARRLQPTVSAARVVVAAAAAPTVLTLVYEWTTGVTPSNAVRFAAGLPIGLAVAWLVVSAATDQVN